MSTLLSRRRSPAFTRYPSAFGIFCSKFYGSPSVLRQSQLPFGRALTLSAGEKISPCLQSLKEDLISRTPRLIFDDLVPTPSHKLQVSLSSFLPASWTTCTHSLPRTKVSDLPHGAHRLLPGNHLVYFNPVSPINKLLPDGSDPFHSPGFPFTRRMWTGGSVRFQNESILRSTLSNVISSPVESPLLDGSRWVCTERIRDATILGNEGDEIVQVVVERRIGAVRDSGSPLLEPERDIVQRLWNGNDDDFADAAIIETRNITFMRQKTLEETERRIEMGNAEHAKENGFPSFVHTLTPNPLLLFCYSALTFNTHALHLIAHYYDFNEGDLDLVVHTPLSLTLLLTMINTHIGGHLHKPKNVISEFTYKSMAPLYSGRKMQLCLRQINKDRWDAWVENHVGQVCVNGHAKTVRVVS